MKILGRKSAGMSMTYANISDPAVLAGYPSVLQPGAVIAGTTPQYAPRLRERFCLEPQLADDARQRGWDRDVDRHTSASPAASAACSPNSANPVFRPKTWHDLGR